MAQDEKQILPHQEVTEAINLGTEEKKKRSKNRDHPVTTIREKLINLLQEYNDVFAWSYQDMLGLWNRYRDTPIAIKRVMRVGQTETEKGQASNVFEN